MIGRTALAVVSRFGPPHRGQERRLMTRHAVGSSKRGHGLHALVDLGLSGPEEAVGRRTKPQPRGAGTCPSVVPAATPADAALTRRRPRQKMSASLVLRAVLAFASPGPMLSRGVGFGR